MLRPLLLASAFALAAPAMAQEVNDDMAPPTTEGMTAPDARDQTAPNLPPGTVPTGIEDDPAEETMDHSAMGHDTTATGSTSVTADATTDASTTGTTGTMTTATTGATADADVGVTADTTTPTATTTADAGMTTSTATTSGAFTGMGGPIDIQSQWSSFDTVGDGLLSPMEFAGWMASSMGRPMTGDMEDQAVELLNETADELALVDTNGDWHVSQAELTAASPR